MRVKCSYCESYIDDDTMVCPYCGATNTRVARYTNEEEEINHRRKMEEMRLRNEYNMSSNAYNIEKTKSRESVIKSVFKGLAIVAAVFVIPFFILIGVLVIKDWSTGYLFPSSGETGYYADAGNKIYYKDYTDTWYMCEGNNEWEALTYSPNSLNYLGWDFVKEGYDFNKSGYRDPNNSNYYIYEDEVYLFYVRYMNWYIYKSGWKKIDRSTVPFELRKHTDLYSTPDWDAYAYPAGTSDFRHTSLFEIESGYYVAGEDTYYYSYSEKWYMYDGTDYTQVKPIENAVDYFYSSYDAPSGVLDFYDSKARKRD